ncbi:MAG: hypothetical protein WCP20_22695 [Desulfuromonadales bacterium]
MPVNLVENEAGATLLLEGIVTAEETDQFMTCLKEHPELALDMSACEHLHTAVLQAIIVLRPHISAMPADPFWSRCIQIEKENMDENNTAG